MSEIETKKYNIAYVVGVYKFDEKVAGYKDLKKLAVELAQDPNFKQIILRHVSSTNWGIHFTYISKSLDEYKIHQEQIQNNQEMLPYAWDIQHSHFASDTTEGLIDQLSEHIILHKPLDIDSYLK